MKNIKLKYKDFIGNTKHSKYDNNFYGRILNTSDLVSYNSTNLKNINNNFRDTVNKYIELCAKHNKIFYFIFQ